MKQARDMFIFLEEQLYVCLESAMLLEEFTCDYSERTYDLLRDRFSLIQFRTWFWDKKVFPSLSLQFFSFAEKELVLYFIDLIQKITKEIHFVVNNLFSTKLIILQSLTPILTKNVTNCIKQLTEAIKSINNLETDDKLKSYVVKINFLESQTDVLYMNAICMLYSKPLDNCIIINNKVIYESIESCCNMCQQAASIIEQFY